jgi:hypothetical protein
MLVKDAVLLIAGGVVGFFVGWIASPWFERPQRRMERIARRMTGVEPLVVHVEQDPAVIHEGEPDWVAFAAWIPSADRMPRRPPELSRAIVSVASAVGGGAAVWQHIRIRLTASQPCFIESIRVSSAVLDPLKDAVLLLCPVGGADVEPRHIRVDFSEGLRPAAVLCNGDGVEDLSTMKLKLLPGEAEELLVEVSGGDTDHRWALECVVTADGRRRSLRIPGEGFFEFRSGSGLPTYLANGGAEWTPA